MKVLKILRERDASVYEIASEIGASIKKINEAMKHIEELRAKFIKQHGWFIPAFHMKYIEQMISED